MKAKPDTTAIAVNLDKSARALSASMIPLLWELFQNGISKDMAESVIYHQIMKFTIDILEGKTRRTVTP